MTNNRQWHHIAMIICQSGIGVSKSTNIPHICICQRDGREPKLDVPRCAECLIAAQAVELHYSGPSYHCKIEEKLIMKKPNAIIFDVDGTLADNRHRSNLLPSLNSGYREFSSDQQEQAWHRYFEAMNHDQVWPETAVLLKAFSLIKDLTVIIVTGRPERYREVTSTWFAANGLSYHSMYMRNNSDRRDNVLFKTSIISELRKKYNIILVLDDQPSVVANLRSLGVTAYHVRDTGHD